MVFVPVFDLLAEGFCAELCELVERPELQNQSSDIFPALLDERFNSQASVPIETIGPVVENASHDPIWSFRNYGYCFWWAMCGGIPCRIASVMKIRRKSWKV